MTGKKRYSRRWTRLIGGLLGLGIVWGFYVSRTSDKEIGAASLHEAKRLFEYTELLPSGEGEIVRHTYYTLSFNSRHKQANWVYYTLELEGKERVAERTDRFREDKKVPSGSAKPSDYIKSGYDRGHLCPAADMAHSAEAMEETFLMSNISPQLPVFNRGIWKSLEKLVRFFLQSSLCSRGPANDCFCSSQYPRKKAIAGLCSDCGFRRTAHKHRFFPTIIRYT